MAGRHAGDRSCPPWGSSRINRNPYRPPGGGVYADFPGSVLRALPQSPQLTATAFASPVRLVASGSGSGFLASVLAPADRLSRNGEEKR